MVGLRILWVHQIESAPLDGAKPLDSVAVDSVNIVASGNMAWVIAAYKDMLLLLPV